MKITRAKLDRIIQEEYAKEARRRVLKENVSVDMGSIFGILQGIDREVNMALDALDSSDTGSAEDLLVSIAGTLRDLMLNIDDMGHDQPGYGA